jgi:hypothetical protein
MIATFIADKMSGYIAGGMAPETAARFTKGELSAIYQGGHYSRDESGAMRLTPPPEDIPIEAARAKCDEAIKEILDYCAGIGATPENPAPMGTVTKIEKPSGAENRNGLEGLKNYVNRRPI